MIFRFFAILLLSGLLQGCAPGEMAAPPLQTAAPTMPPALILSMNTLPTSPCEALPTAQPSGLRTLAQARGLLIGAAAAVNPLQQDERYAQTLAREFNLLTPENALKFGPLRPARGEFFFKDGDALVDFATAHAMQVRGHTLVWHNQNPTWLTEGSFSREEMRAILKEHITTVVSHYVGRVAAWDVVNEAFNDDGSLRDTLWLRALGPEYIELAFQWAHAADPQARLFYNDYNAEDLGRKSDAVYRLAADLRQRGVPLHGVGLQMHLNLASPPRSAALADNIQRLAALGLSVHITEMDVRIQGAATPAALAGQARVYGEVLQACQSSPACQALVLWGFSDRYSWIPQFFKGYGAALIFDESFAPKPAYAALADRLRQP